MFTIKLLYLYIATNKHIICQLHTSKCQYSPKGATLSELQQKNHTIISTAHVTALDARYGVHHNKRYVGKIQLLSISVCNPTPFLSHRLPSPSLHFLLSDRPLACLHLAWCEAYFGRSMNP